MWELGRKLDSRVRLNVDAVRGSLARARDVEHTLRTIPGVLAVEIDPETGSTVIEYDPHPNARGVLEPARVPAEVTALAPVRREPRGTDALSKFVETIVVVGLELLLQRTLGPLFWPRRC